MQNILEVTVDSIEGNIALVTDSMRRQLQVPLLVRRGGGPLPRVGERWIIDRTLGNQWTFHSVLRALPPEITGDNPSEVVASVAQVIQEMGLGIDKTGEMPAWDNLVTHEQAYTTRLGTVITLFPDGDITVSVSGVESTVPALLGGQIRVGDQVQVLCLGGHPVLVLGRTGAPPEGPANVHRYTGAGTWTKPSGLKYVRVKVQGGGGAGGGRTQVSGQASLGCGGAGGGYVEGLVWARDLPSSAPVVVGSGGSGVSGGNGQAGGASWFGAEGTAHRLWADGGGGGVRVNFAVGSNGSGTLTPGGGASIGSFVRQVVNRTGQQGSRAWYFGAMHTSAMTPGQGGASMLGAGGAAPGLGQTGVAHSGVGWGGGGSGLCGLNQAAASGGTGAQGTVIVEEYF